jgi:hypothetical protein
MSSLGDSQQQSRFKKRNICRYFSSEIRQMHISADVSGFSAGKAAKIQVFN